MNEISLYSLLKLVKENPQVRMELVDKGKTIKLWNGSEVYSMDISSGTMVHFEIGAIPID